jgi:hypothetical protein
MRFCNQGTEFYGRYERRGTDFQSNWEIIKVLLFYSQHWRSVAVQVGAEPLIGQGAEV